VTPPPASAVPAYWREIRHGSHSIDFQPIDLHSMDIDSMVSHSNELGTGAVIYSHGWDH
jgi:hypothetical protein